MSLCATCQASTARRTRPTWAGCPRAGSPSPTPNPRVRGATAGLGMGLWGASPTITALSSGRWDPAAAGVQEKGQRSSGLREAPQATSQAVQGDRVREEALKGGVWPAGAQDFCKVGARTSARTGGTGGSLCPHLPAPISPSPSGSNTPVSWGGWAEGFEGISLPAWTGNTTRGMWKCGCPCPSLWSLSLPVLHLLALSPALPSATRLIQAGDSHGQTCLHLVRFFFLIFKFLFPLILSWISLLF